MHTVDIYRDNMLLTSVKPEAESAQVKRVMAENELQITFKDSQYIDFQIGDKATVFDELYFINTVPVYRKISAIEHEYVLKMESTRQIVQKTQLLFLGDNNTLKEGDFSLTGRAIEFITLVINNLQRHQPYFNFVAGQIENTDYKTITFNSVNCLDALAKIAEAFETEYWIEGFTVSLTAIGRDTGYTFRHGKRKGLYELTRQTVDNSAVVTRLYAFGSDKNLPENYRNFSKRLKLPSQGTKTVTNVVWSIADNGNGTDKYTFNWDTPQVSDQTGVYAYYRPKGSSSGFIGLTNGSVLSPRVYDLPAGEYEFYFETMTPQVNTGQFNTPYFLVTNTAPQPAIPFAGEVIYIEKNRDKYGLSEATVIIDDVYPHRTGAVTGINIANVFEFTDAGIDFDVNGYLLPGMTPKITFNSGQLSGYTFDVYNFNNTFKRFTILKNKNERAIEVPSADFKMAIGDKYVITDIKMPGTYIDAAEGELQVAAENLLDVLSEPQLSYQLIFDPVYLEEKKYNLKLGDLIWIIDPVLNIQRKFRIVQYQRRLTNEYDFTLDVADTLRKSKVQALTTGQGVLTDTVSNINSNLQNNSILNNRVIGDLIITGQSSIKFENLQTGSGLTPVGIDADGKLWKI
jgi:hypothetical protein